MGHPALEIPLALIAHSSPRCILESAGQRRTHLVCQRLSCEFSKVSCKARGQTGHYSSSVLKTILQWDRCRVAESGKAVAFSRALAVAWILRAPYV